jgi:hypothetical protein
MPSNACFANVNSIGVPRLRRVLRALAWLYPEIGYCQGTGMVSNLGGNWYTRVFSRPLLRHVSLRCCKGGRPGLTWESSRRAMGSFFFPLGALSTSLKRCAEYLS